MKIIYTMIMLFALQLNLFAIEQITVAGTGDSQQLLRALALEFEKQNPNTKINVPNSIGSGGGVKNTALGKCDLGRVARPIKKSEEKYMLNYIVFAYSPIVFITNPSVKNLASLTEQQLVDIYTGKIKTWEEVGALSGDILVASRESGDSSKAIIDKELKEFAKVKQPVGEVIFSTPKLIETISRYKNTIGYATYSSAVENNLNIVNLNGIKPTSENIQKKLYTLYLPFGIVYKGKLNPLSKRFVEFLQTKSTKKMIVSLGAIPK